MKKKLLLFLILFFGFFNIAMANPFCIKEPLCVREPEKGIYLIKINPNIYSIHTFAVDGLMKSEDVFKNNNFVAVLNGGYFDFGNYKTVSFVLKDEKILLDPMQNEHLSQNMALKPNLDLILNRGEFRVLDCGGKIKYDILKHYDIVKNGCKIVDSLQAGPIIYPEDKSEEEYFVKRNAEGKLIRNAIQADRKRPRTAVGIKGNKVYFIVATRENPMTLNDLHEFCKRYDFDKVLNLDGGGSTSFTTSEYNIKSEYNDTQRRVKSFLIVE